MIIFKIYMSLIRSLLQDPVFSGILLFNFKGTKYNFVTK